jgi:transposase
LARSATDAIDARALARYGQEREPRLMRWQPPDHAREQLQALVLTRRDLVAERQACSNRLAAPGTGVVQPYLAKLEACLREQIAAIGEAIEALIHKHTPLKAATETLRSVSGIGATTAAALVALMPELGRLDRRQAAALAGLAPHPNQSGATNAYRRTKGGRPEVKRSLFMAAMSAIKHNKILKAFYQRLKDNGKKPIVALIAVMRKLIVICNAMLRPKIVDDATKTPTQL